MQYKKILTLFLAILFLTSCSKENQTIVKNTSTAHSSIDISSKAGSYTIPEHIEKIAVLDFATLDTLFALGANNIVVALPRNSKIPEHLSIFNNEKYINTGTVKDGNLEKIAQVSPQLIIISDRLQDATTQLKKISPVYNFTIDYNQFWTSFKKNNLTIAKIIGKSKEAEIIIDQLEKEIKLIKEKAKDKKALVILVNNDKIFTYGKGSRFGSIHDVFGFDTADDHIKIGIHGQSISFEYLIEKNPDYIFVIDRAAAITDKMGNAKNIIENKLIKETNAYKNKHIIYLNATNWYLMNGGLHATQEMVKEIANALNQ